MLTWAIVLGTDRMKKERTWNDFWQKERGLELELEWLTISCIVFWLSLMFLGFSLLVLLFLSLRSFFLLYLHLTQSIQLEIWSHFSRIVFLHLSFRCCFSRNIGKEDHLFSFRVRCQAEGEKNLTFTSGPTCLIHLTFQEFHSSCLLSSVWSFISFPWNDADDDKKNRKEELETSHLISLCWSEMETFLARNQRRLMVLLLLHQEVIEHRKVLQLL